MTCKKNDSKKDIESNQQFTNKELIKNQREDKDITASRPRNDKILRK